MTRSIEEQLEILVEIAVGAGAVILPFYSGHKDMGAMIKDDCSPVTLADQQAEEFILEALAVAFPGIPVVAEEKCAAGDVPDLDAEGDGAFFLVDPLDGTKEFINGRDEFTVNIGLIRDGVPVMGVIYAPALRDVYVGGIESGAYCMHSLEDPDDFLLSAAERIEMRPAGNFLTAVASRSHMNEETRTYMEERGISDFISAGSSLKFCLVAAGRADVYPRFGRTMEWDTAAGDAILRAAGGMTVRTDGSPFVYGKRNQAEDSDFANPFFIAGKR